MTKFIVLNLFFTCAVVLCAVITHQVLLNVTLYRWLINSIIYPLSRYKLKKRLANANDFELAQMFINTQGREHWSDNFWFAKRLKALIIKKIIPQNRN